MKPKSATETLFTTGFLLNKIGKSINDRFTEKIACLGIRPKHCGLLATVKAYPPMSQQQLGKALGLVPSAIVTILDELKELGAISRIDSTTDRRRYTIKLTSTGEKLLKEAVRIAAEVDAECFVNLRPDEREALARTLGAVAQTLGDIPGTG